MQSSGKARLLTLLLGLAAGLLAVRYGLSLLLPFLAGLLIALIAEPAVRYLTRRFRLRRSAAAFLCVSAVLILLAALGLLLCAALLRWLGQLTAVLPDLETTAGQGLLALEDWLLALSQQAPEGIRPLLTKTVLGLFENGGQLYTQAMAQLPAMATGLLSRLTGGALGMGTGILAAYLISARLPKLRQWFQTRLPEAWKTRYLPMLRRMRAAVSGWLRAQTTLMGLTFLLLWIGFLALRIPHALLWAAGIALVDAIPMLGTGLILIPWSLVCVLQQLPGRAVGLLVLFAAATACRSTLEPRLVGKELGLDPLVTLLALYLGYQVLGIPGMLVAPLLAVMVTQLTAAVTEEK